MSPHALFGTTMLLYGLINPIGVAPIYLSLVRRIPAERAHRTILVAALTVATLLAAAAAFGREILSFFNVGMDEFRIAGGLLSLVIAFEMFRAHYGSFSQTLEERAEAEADVHSIAITPLAFPLLVGPAEMSVMISLSNGLTRTWDKIALMGIAVLATCLVAGTLWLASPIKRLLGSTGINIATRLMALIVASVAINFILTGVKHQLHGVLASD